MSSCCSVQATIRAGSVGVGQQGQRRHPVPGTVGCAQPGQESVGQRDGDADRQIGHEDPDQPAFEIAPRPGQAGRLVHVGVVDDEARKDEEEVDAEQAALDDQAQKGRHRTDEVDRRCSGMMEDHGQRGDAAAGLENRNDPGRRVQGQLSSSTGGAAKGESLRHWRPCSFRPSLVSPAVAGSVRLRNAPFPLQAAIGPRRFQTPARRVDRSGVSS